MNITILDSKFSQYRIGKNVQNTRFHVQKVGNFVQKVGNFVQSYSQNPLQNKSLEDKFGAINILKVYCNT